ncbi:sigma-70 family RNA polymerase sigma factor [Streptomyces sp. CC224B]|uniref:sigma-70 family RNA polymerase sigma factor n=1 Tax=Streptomyces sp. CC224B TaxID=3044571 RepID=UPI0024A9984D|nr:sigma-70 family RNA polymerase sigma factor [Streptomyces sp. CC224B]
MSHQLIGKISPLGGAEPELIRRARTGDREAFALLYNAHRENVYRYLVHRTRDRHLAEDLTQEVFVRALRKIETFAWRGTNFAAWLTIIAKNLHLDYVRKPRVQREIPVAGMHDTDAARDRSTEASVLRELSVAEAAVTVAAAMRSLTPAQQRCVRLRFLHELSVQETADRMGKQVNAVKSIQHRAMKGMQRALASAEVSA